MKQHLYIEWFYGHYVFPDVGSGRTGKWIYDKDKVRNPQCCAICLWAKDHPYHM